MTTTQYNIPIFFFYQKKTMTGWELLNIPNFRPYAHYHKTEIVELTTLQ